MGNILILPETLIYARNRIKTNPEAAQDVIDFFKRIDETHASLLRSVYTHDENMIIMGIDTDHKLHTKGNIACLLNGIVVPKPLFSK